MPVRTILGIIGVDHGDGDRLALQELCAANGAHLSLLLASVSQPPPVGLSPPSP